MTKLSICIPVEAGSIDAVPLVRTLLANREADVEIVVATTTDATFAPDSQTAGDARLTIVPMTATVTTQQLWRRAAAASTGDWVTLITPADMIETDLTVVVDFIERSSPTVDALAWTVLQIDPKAEPGKTSSVAIPTSYHIDKFDKTVMLKAFFYWENSLQAPKMPFGLHHAAIRRSLMDTLLALPEPQDWSTTLPQYEWAAKVLLFSDSLAFSSRPLSALSLTRFDALSAHETAWNFPFTAALGLTGAIAEVQFHCLRELGSAWTADAAFVRACMIDCMMETQRETYLAKGNAYYAALQQFDEGLAGTFRPEFHAERPYDRRQGVHNKAILIDRFVGGAQTAPEFYNVIKSMVAPIGLICGGVTASV